MEKQHYYHILTFGCQMNKSDSERLASILQSMGLEVVDKPEEADVIVMNSCSVRESAEHRIFGNMENFRKLKKKKPNLIVVLTGCMPGRDKDGKLKEKLKDVDLFFPTSQMIMLPKLLSELNPNLVAVETANHYLQTKPNYSNNFQAFIPIQTGCDHFCTYCVVPYARGKERNRPLKEVLDEIKDLSFRGCKEVTLLGEIVNHYMAPDPEFFSKNNIYKKNNFAKLLWEINQIKGIERIHWTGPHPIYMDEEMIDALTLPKQINFLHLPVQSGNTEILKKMNRRHDREFYFDLVKKIRKKKPDIAIGTDIIVGFCGETEKQFQDTLDFYKECDFDIVYVAQYSQRSNTAAAKAFEDDIPKIEKKRRWLELQNLMEKITLQKNQKYLDKKISVLVDSYEKGVCTGNSSEMKRTSFRGDKSMVGSIVIIKVNKAQEWILWGEMV